MRVHQVVVVRVPVLDDVGDPAAPLVADRRMQLDAVRLLRHLVGHEADRQPAIELEVQEVAIAIADHRVSLSKPCHSVSRSLAPWVRASAIGSAWSEVLL